MLRFAPLLCIAGLSHAQSANEADELLEQSLDQLTEMLESFDFQLDLNNFLADSAESQEALAAWFDTIDATLLDADLDYESLQEDLTDRWDALNLDMGWDLEQISAELETYFEENDIGELDQFDLDAFALEYERVAAMFEKGLESGKIDEYVAQQRNEIITEVMFNPDNWAQFADTVIGTNKPVLDEVVRQAKRARNDDTQSRRDKKVKGGKGRDSDEELFSMRDDVDGRGRKDRRDGKDDDDLEEWQLIVITAVASVLVTVLITVLILCCVRKRGRKNRNVEHSESESELRDTPQVPQSDGQYDQVNNRSSIPNAMSPDRVPRAASSDKVNQDHLANEVV